MTNQTKTFELNKPQMLCHLINPNNLWALVGRGGGKSVGILAPRMLRVAEAMPGHLSGLFGSDYEQLDNNIIPKLLLGFTMLGYQRDVDFVVGIRPPDNWPKCLYPIKDFSRCITWRNGTTFVSVSLHKRGSANAFDFQSGFFDEAKFMNEAQLEDEVFPTFRGFENMFGHLPEYLSKTFTTDKMGDFHKVKWLLDKRKKVNTAKCDAILQMQYKVSELQQRINDATRRQEAALKAAINHLNYKCNKLRMGLTYVCEASAIDNIKNLGKAWLADKKKNMSPYEFKVAILNHDPEKSKEGFYPHFGEAQLYNNLFNDCDNDVNKPLLIAMDYQYSIAPMCVAQIHQLPWETKPTLNYIREFYTLYPFSLKKCIDDFCSHYAFRPCKIVNYIYDATAIGLRAEAVPVKDIVIAQFKLNGWSVLEVNYGDTPNHYDKYVKINDRFQLVQDGTFSVRVNRDTCPKLIISINATSTKAGTNGETKKDKDYENTKKHPNVDQSETTHFPDTFDQIEWAVNERKIVSNHSGGVGGIGFR